MVRAQKRSTDARMSASDLIQRGGLGFEGFNARDQLLDLLVSPRFICLSAMRAKKCSTWLIHDEDVGLKC
jgi:hypothetical protein